MFTTAVHSIRTKEDILKIDNVINDANFKSDVSSKYTVLHMDFSEATFKKTVVNPDDDKKVQEKAEKFAQEFSVEKAYGNTEDLFSDELNTIISKGKFTVLDANEIIMAEANK